MLNAESRFTLPAAPPSLADAPVAAWEQDVVIDTYEPLPPSRYPLYLDRRVYQGSSGRVYPMPFHERISATKVPRAWRAVHLENRWVRLMVLPELGGRIHVGMDKTNGYDFFYRNNVIKPALVGLLGPWISGGVEFNWPQHHRPATYLPVDATIEHEPDGAVTVWCSDLDPFARLKGMHGIRLRPDSALVELRVRLYNRTDDVQTFLWWANVAAPVNDDYQSYFPPDVHWVADHAKRAVASFPRVSGSYYGVDYPSRVDAAHPDADRIDWYRNIPVPTSYMCVDSTGDFFGGFDHGVRAGFVHWADHRIAPGKKQWTWGNAPFGRAWDRNLTDGDGPYIELMAGVFTDNQPDFTFLAPGETKAFSQYWYPIREIGTVQAATRDAALHLDVDDSGELPVAAVGVAVTSVRAGARVVLTAAGVDVWSLEVDLDPAAPFVTRVVLPRGTAAGDVAAVVTHGAEELVSRPVAPATQAQPPRAATQPPAPEDLSSTEELYLTGLHLEQYRHATRSPEPYWLEALRRDPGDSRASVALAARRQRAGLLEEAEALLRAAVERRTARNPNPYDGEAHYRLGLVLRDRGRVDEAYDLLAKATWSAPWRVPGWVAMARLSLARGDAENAAALAARALAVDTEHLQALAIQAICLRALGRADEAERCLAAAGRVDPLDWWVRDLRGDLVDGDPQVLVDLALEYASCGAVDDALRLLDRAAAVERERPTPGQVRVGPLAGYHRAALLDGAGRHAEAAQARRAARGVDPIWCFPGRLADAIALERSVAAEPDDAVAWALLGHWRYAAGRRHDAVEAWTRSGPDDAVVARNLGMAAFNVAHDPDAAARWYERAVELAPRDSRLLSERDQLARRCGEDPVTRLARLDANPALVAERDDLSAQRAVLLTLTGDPEAAVALLSERVFQPWEGGEGVVLGAWDLAQLSLAHRYLGIGDGAAAERAVRAALESPANLGEARHELANRADLMVALGDALALQGERAAACDAWREAATAEGDFVEMAPTEVSEKTVSSALAWRRLGEPDRAEGLLDRIAAAADRAGSQDATIDYFATSLPTLLLFDDDATQRLRVTGAVLRAQVAAIRGRVDDVEALLEPALEADPANPHIHLLRGVAAQTELSVPTARRGTGDDAGQV